MKINCLTSILPIAFLLILQSANAQYNFGKVDDWLDQNIKELGGRAVLLVYKDGKQIYTSQKNELNGRQRMMEKMVARRQGKDADEMLRDYDENSRINIASCSKWLSAALVMTFVDEGKLNINDTIGKFLPVMSKNGKGNISITDCLAHLTGIKPGKMQEDIKLFRNSKNMDEVMNLLAARPMEEPAGTSFHYSSVGLQIAAAVIEKISGKDFETLFRERIANPCNMVNTDFGKKAVPLPAGGAVSTAKDFLRFLEMILHNGEYKGKRVLSANSISLMQRNYAAGKKVVSSPAEAGKWGYGFGEWVMDDAVGENRSGAVTSPGLFGSFPYVDNNLQYTAVLFTFNLNNKGRNERYMQMKKLIDEAVQGR